MKNLRLSAHDSYRAQKSGPPAKGPSSKPEQKAGKRAEPEQPKKNERGGWGRSERAPVNIMKYDRIPK